MANETTKAHNRRAKDPIFQEVFQGLTIEMGSGADPLHMTPEFPDLKVEHAVDWAGNYPNFLKADVESFGELPGQEKFIGRYDLVYSSQCLEHLLNAGRAIFNWWSLVKIGGSLVLTLPDFTLYEQGWPHRWNSGHKTAWKLRKTYDEHEEEKGSPGCIPLLELCQSLPGGEIMKCELVDTNYDYMILADVQLGKREPVDQTMSDAEAWLEAVIRKTK